MSRLDWLFYIWSGVFILAFVCSVLHIGWILWDISVANLILFVLILSFLVVAVIGLWRND